MLENAMFCLLKCCLIAGDIRFLSRQIFTNCYLKTYENSVDLPM